jgi:hypothetical protein
MNWTYVDEEFDKDFLQRLEHKILNNIKKTKTSDLKLYVYMFDDYYISKSMEEVILTICVKQKYTLQDYLFDFVELSQNDEPVIISIDNIIKKMYDIFEQKPVNTTIQTITNFPK